MTLPVVQLRGTPYEQGVQHGRELRDRIAHNLAVYFERFEREAKVPRAGVLARASQYGQAIAKQNQDYFAGLRGIADGSELGPQQVDLVCDVFERLNLLVSALLDRDHQIGHSYFLEVDSTESLCRTLYRKVFPLLQEYFYNDHEQLRRLLGGYHEGKKKGFVRLRAGNVVDADGGAVSKDLLPWELHRYEPGEIEEVLRHTFLPDG